jgi:hypothetical protein
MKLKELTEDGVVKERPQTSKPKKRVIQKDEHQGKSVKQWYTPKTAGPVAKTYRWGTGKPMSGDGYSEHLLRPGH